MNKLETPTVLIDNQKLEANIRQISGIAQKHNLKVRPHIKTHKSKYIADLQLLAGASGLTVATYDEAMHFLEMDTPSLTIARPLIFRSQIKQLIEKATERNVYLNFICDHQDNFDPTANSAQKLNQQVGMYLKIDVGLHRCGMDENNPEMINLAKKMYEDTHTEFKGLLSHAGHAYSAKNKAEVMQIAITENAILNRIKQKIELANIPVHEISVGTTPTILCSRFYRNITEIRPGNYVFMDRTPLRLGLINKQQIALSILTTIISKNKDYFIIDAGSKTLSSDAGAHGNTDMQGYGLAYPANAYLNTTKVLIIEKLSEEHGFARRDNQDYALGTQLRIIPNHSCVVANLAQSFYLTENDEIAGKMDKYGGLERVAG